MGQSRPHAFGLPGGLILFSRPPGPTRQWRLWGRATWRGVWESRPPVCLGAWFGFALPALVNCGRGSPTDHPSPLGLDGVKNTVPFGTRESLLPQIANFVADLWRQAAAASQARPPRRFRHKRRVFAQCPCLGRACGISAAAAAALAEQPTCVQVLAYFVMFAHLL